MGEFLLSEVELRQLLARLLSGGAEVDDEELLASDQDLCFEVERRLEACGVRLHRSPGQAPLCVIEAENDGLSELARASLALCAVALRKKPGSERRPRIAVEELRQRVAPSYTAAYLRRAALGPLEQRGLVRVVKPGQRAEEAYVVAGPALAAIDVEALINHLTQR